MKTLLVIATVGLSLLLAGNASAGDRHHNRHNNGYSNWGNNNNCYQPNYYRSSNRYYNAPRGYYAAPRYYGVRPGLTISFSTGGYRGYR